jgi:hypothetical protein
MSVPDYVYSDGPCDTQIAMQSYGSWCPICGHAYGVHRVDGQCAACAGYHAARAE